MHSYLRAIGFHKVKNQTELDKLIQLIIQEPSTSSMVMSDSQTMFAELSKEFAQNMGVALRGEYDDAGEFHLENYYPYYIGSVVSTKEEVLFNKKVDSDSYTGMCDDVRVGVSLIFYLQNVLEYMDNTSIHGKYDQYFPVRLSALSLKGKILLGVEKEQKKKKGSYETRKRNQLLAEARQGNQEAIDSLTIDDIDLYTMITRRAKYEDLYSIVESTFIPYGSESDNYSVIGTITDCQMVENQYTKENVYVMGIECNDLHFQVCINELDLEGEPLPGRRFKGVIWMQGRVEFKNE